MMPVRGGHARGAQLVRNRQIIEGEELLSQQFRPPEQFVLMAATIVPAAGADGNRRNPAAERVRLHEAQRRSGRSLDLIIP